MPNPVYEGPKKHHEPQRVPSQVVIRCQTIGETQRSCGLQSEFRECHQNLLEAAPGIDGHQHFFTLVAVISLIGILTTLVLAHNTMNLF